MLDSADDGFDDVAGVTGLNPDVDHYSCVNMFVQFCMLYHAGTIANYHG